MDDFKGILYPARLPTFHRVPAPAAVKDLVQWFWIPEWNIAPGHSSRQQVLSFPASNLVVQQDGVELAGPTTRASNQDLRGFGWAVGALLLPASVPLFTAHPAGLHDTLVEISAPTLLADVVRAMGHPDGETRRNHAVELVSRWLVEQLPEVSEEALLANAMAAMIAQNPALVRVEDVAEGLSVSVRTLQRLAKKYVGLGPAALIRRRRLQEAADRARSHPDLELAEIAAEYGYADQSHLANDFQRVLGFTASSYRQQIGAL